MTGDVLGKIAADEGDLSRAVRLLEQAVAAEPEEYLVSVDGDAADFRRRYPKRRSAVLYWLVPSIDFPGCHGYQAQDFRPP